MADRPTPINNGADARFTGARTGVVHAMEIEEGRVRWKGRRRRGRSRRRRRILFPSYKQKFKVEDLRRIYEWAPVAR